MYWKCEFEGEGIQCLKCHVNIGFLVFVLFCEFAFPVSAVQFVIVFFKI